MGYGCEDYAKPGYCGNGNGFYTEDFNADEMCCVCGGGSYENPEEGGNDEGGNDDGATCQDTNNGAKDNEGLNCFFYEKWDMCDSENYYDEDFNAKEMCCACGGGSTA